MKHCLKEMKLLPHILQMQQFLVQVLENRKFTFVDNLWHFSRKIQKFCKEICSKVHPPVNGCVNKQNVCIWAVETYIQ